MDKLVFPKPSLNAWPGVVQCHSILCIRLSEWSVSSSSPLQYPKHSTMLKEVPHACSHIHLGKCPVRGHHASRRPGTADQFNSAAADVRRCRMRRQQRSVHICEDQYVWWLCFVPGNCSTQAECCTPRDHTDPWHARRAASISRLVQQLSWHHGSNPDTVRDRVFPAPRASSSVWLPG